MSGLVVKRFSEPDETIRVTGVVSGLLQVGETKIAYDVHEPGCRWSTHVKPLVGTNSCEVRHVGYVISGRMGVRLDSGEEAVIQPGDAFAIPPGHDGWVEGDERLVTLDWTGVDEWLRPPDQTRVLATLVMTDIVNSTGQLRALGDRRWREVLAEHERRMRAIATSAGVRFTESTGDGFLFAFDGAARAVRAALKMVESAAELAVPIRAAVAAGEIELVGSGVRGIAVHAVARILSVAQQGEVLVSNVTRVLAEGGGLTFDDRGPHNVKGFDEPMNLFAAQPVR
jgi:class 3 adenylate cyclase